MLIFHEKELTLKIKLKQIFNLKNELTSLLIWSQIYLLTIF